MILFLTEGGGSTPSTPAPFETPRYVGRPAFHHFFAYLSLVKNAVFFWKCWVFASCYGDHRHFLAILIRKKGCFVWKCWVFSIFGWGDGQGGPFTGKDAGKTSWQWTSFGASSPGGKIVKMLECRTANRPWSFNRRRGEVPTYLPTPSVRNNILEIHTERIPPGGIHVLAPCVSR